MDVHFCLLSLECDFLFFYLFIIFGCIGSSLLHAGCLQLRRAGATPHRGARASHCGGLSRCGARALGARASVVAAHRLSSCGSQALERRLSSCGARAQLLRSMWDPPGPGIEPVCPALAGGFPTTAPPGKSQECDFLKGRDCVLATSVFPQVSSTRPGTHQI